MELCPVTQTAANIHVFGESHLEDVAAAYGLDVLRPAFPSTLAIASACDQGRIEEARRISWTAPPKLLEHLGDLNPCKDSPIQRGLSLLHFGGSSSPCPP